MERTPLVAMKSKSGELDALLRLESMEAKRVWPCVELVADVQGGTGRLSEKLATAVIRLHQFGQTILLDATQLHPTSSLWQKPRGPLSFMSEYLTQECGLLADGSFVPFVPVVSFTAADQHLRDVSLVREAHDCMLALRVDPARLPVSEAADRVQYCLDVMRVEANTVALVVDVGYLARKLAAKSAACLRTIAELKHGFSFKSITVLSGSIPTSTGRANLIPASYGRPELTLWQTVAGQEPTVGYGDYGIVHPVAPAPRLKSNPVNVPNPYLYYTGRRCSRFTIRKMRRGKNRRPLPGEKPERYFREVAQELVASAEYKSDTTNSWGDKRLRCCSRGDGTAGTSPQWIEMGTSHHLAHLAANGDQVPASGD